MMGRFCLVFHYSLLIAAMGSLSVLERCMTSASDPVLSDLPSSDSTDGSSALADDASELASRVASVGPTLTARFQDDGVLVQEGEKPVLFYQRSTKSLDGGWPRAGYVHPLYDLEGRVITEDFPDDHPHHRGIFWAWHQVWVGEQRFGDPWVCDDFEWDVQALATNSPAAPLGINGVVHWKSPSFLTPTGKSIPIVKETIRITVHPQKEGARCIDFDISLQALVDEVRIGGSEDSKGYGGFSPRIKMSPPREFHFESGPVEPTKNAIVGGPWVDIRNDQNGVVIMAHPNNPMTEQGHSWILRRKRSMQNSVYPGRQAVSVSMNSPTRLRYRLMIHDGGQTKQNIQACFDKYVALAR